MNAVEPSPGAGDWLAAHAERDETTIERSNERTIQARTSSTEAAHRA